MTDLTAPGPAAVQPLTAHRSPLTASDGLKPQLGLFDATMINVGTIVGASIFVVPSAIAAAFSASFPTLMVWIAGGVVSLFGALAVAELGAAMPRAGGQYIYLQRAFGPLWGFLYGWGAAVVINPAALAFVAVAFGSYLGFFFPMSPLGIKLVAGASILALTALNCFGLRTGATTQNVLTLIKIGAVIGFVALCFLLPGGGPANIQPLWPAEPLGTLIAPFGLAMILVLGAYDGWIETTYVGSELRDPGKDMARSMVFSTLLVTVLYVGVSLACIWVLGRAATAASTLVAADAMRVVLGPAGGAFITIAILISTTGANNGIVFTSARIPYAMALEGRFFRWAAKLDPVHRSPNRVMVVQGFWASALVFTGTYTQLLTYMVFVSFLFYALSCAAVMVLRRREPGMPRPYRTWGYPLTPVVFILFSGYLILNTIVNAPRDAAIGGGLLLVGLPVYAWCRKRYAMVSGEQ
ncbi:MAG TPA: amino acid permease [Gemmatimonadales bacterium]|nr:amino acid permease [Gemmatimonadales bacterium]